MSSEKTIKDALKGGKLVIGKNSVTNSMKNGSLTIVFYSANCLAEFVKELEYYSRISKVPVQKFDGDSAKLGQMCGKPFKIVILGIEK